MPPSFKFSIRHLLYAIAAAAFLFWLVKNSYDFQQIAEAQAKLRAAKIAGSIYLYDKLLSDKNVIGKTPAEIPGLIELSIEPKQINEREFAEWAINYGDIVRSAPLTPAQTVGAQGNSAEEKNAASERNPTLTYVSGDRALLFATSEPLQTEGSKTVGFWVYVRDGKILAILVHVHRVPS